MFNFIKDVYKPNLEYSKAFSNFYSTYVREDITWSDIENGYEGIIIIPGFKKENIDIKFEKGKNILSIKAKNSESSRTRKSDFNYSVMFDEDIDENINAEYIDGILKIKVKIKENKENEIKININ